MKKSYTVMIGKNGMPAWWPIIPKAPTADMQLASAISKRMWREEAYVVGSSGGRLGGNPRHLGPLVLLVGVRAVGLLVHDRGDLRGRAHVGRHGEDEVGGGFPALLALGQLGDVRAAARAAPFRV